ncbi:dTDP-4-dehydrorhamnose reductase [Thalassomonas sp. M1454]|uniref:dTDP-4-dehydrorhamnose reductase n=1 Tax=Thalassomonas sp. M1454 TaxID=2594477 RepID=UPI00117F1ED5|nr:dTDP-4-dehydrorhamnose reductase [Thalassomonas sp. M1454]TRX57186.1 dTDP-4-dehydrorhamnose reductase [Thalassomonas sp. M1454]
MNIVVIGKSGQVAWELSQLNCSDVQINCLGRDNVDIFDIDGLLDAFGTADGVINASAYTAVDLAESESEEVFKVNSAGVKNIALACKSLSIPLVHISTDFVFDGDKGYPYLVDDAVSPIGVYGASKAEGESELFGILNDNGCVIRTSWVYSSHGNNFVKTMLRLMAEKPALGVVGDQIGSPTYAGDLAKACVFALQNKLSGIYHWTDDGIASWYDFAISIQELGIEKGLLDNAIPINAIRTEDYPTPAKRPSYSVLDKTLTKEVFTDLPLVHWRKQLSRMLDKLAKQSK